MSEIYVPLVPDEMTWEKDVNYVFLDESFLTKKKHNYQYYVISHNDVTCPVYEDIVNLRIKIGKILTEEFNKYHGENMPEWYWNNIIHCWLHEFIFNVFDKHARVNWIVKNYDSYKFQFVDRIRRSYNDYEEYLEDSYKGDDSFIDLYSDIIMYANINTLHKIPYNYNKRNVEYNNTTFINKVVMALKNSRNLKNFVSRCFTKLQDRYYKCIHKNQVKILMLETDWQLETRNKIAQKAHGSIVFDSIKFDLIGSQSLDLNFRKRLKNRLMNELANGKTNEKCLASLLAMYIPCCYIENYKKIISQIPNEVYKAKVIFSVTGFLHFPIMLSGMRAKAMNGTKIITMQHGGNYGIQKYVGWYEREWSDIYYIWGMAQMDPDDNSIAEIRLGPSGKFKEHKRVLSSKYLTNTILIGGAAVIKHETSLSISRKISCEDYIKRQMEIIDNIAPAYRLNIVLRNHDNECGWNINETMKNKFSEISISEKKGQYSFIDELKQCKLYIVDHMYTTWIEALFINKPFIIVMNDDEYVFNEKEKKFINKMKRVGVIINTNELSYINNIIDNVDAWWDDAERKHVIKEIRERYLGISLMSEDSLIDWWLQELIQQV